MLEPTHHFLCLNKMHRWQRFQLVIKLLERKLDQFGKISYIDTAGLPNTQFNNRFPMIIDSPTIDWHTQFDYTDQSMTRALFNIVTESSYETEPGATHIEHHCFPALTEKTYKCFGMSQIPIWLAPYQAVECYRELGFDVFDDIVDHSYDMVKNPFDRITTAIDNNVHLLSDGQLVKQLWQANQPRFVKNIDTAKNITIYYQGRVEKLWKNLHWNK